MGLTLEVGTFNFTAAHILNCCLGVVMYTYYAFTKNWIMSNLFGLAVAFNSLEVLSHQSPVLPHDLMPLHLPPPLCLAIRTGKCFLNPFEDVHNASYFIQGS